MAGFFSTSLTRSDLPSRFGQGWRLATQDSQIQLNLPPTGRDNLGLYTPLEVGSRLYLTTPTGELGLRLPPQRRQQTGVAFYTPAWVADPGNPVSGEQPDPEYKLTAPDGTVYHLSSTKGSNSGQSISYGATTQVLPITADLGAVGSFTG